MTLSAIGRKMSSASGIRSIMDDIAATSAAEPGEWLNLSIGNPAPIPEVKATWLGLAAEALHADFAVASCQYGASRGAPQLVSAIVDYFNGRYSWGIGPENVVVGPGSQLLCYIAAALYTEPASGSRLILPMLPDYAGYQGISMHAAGVVGIPALVEVEDDRRFRYQFDFPTLEQIPGIGLLLLSTPSNPTGRSVTPDELARLTELANRRHVPLLLDHAYGQPFPQIAETFAPPPCHPQVINCFTFSKAGIPGERIGFAIGGKHYIGDIVAFLANSALHTPQLMQLAAARALATGRLDRLVSDVITPFYRDRRKLAENLLGELLPPEVRWRVHSGEGGMFLWLWVDEDWFSDLTLYEELKARRVFIAPGSSFFTPDQREPGQRDSSKGPHARRCFRISLSADEDVLHEGITRISDVMRMRRRP